MFKPRKMLVLLISLLALVLAGCSVSTEVRPYEDDSITFTIPAGWQTRQEVWGEDAVTAPEFKGLGVYEIVLIQYPPRQGDGRAYFVVASSPLEAGQDLETRFNQTYQNASPAIEDATQQDFEYNDLTGYEITYDRPWGEPWWHFRDIWIEHDGMVYVLSFYSSAGSFDSYSETLDQILGSFQFQD